MSAYQASDLRTRKAGVPSPGWGTPGSSYSTGAQGWGNGQQSYSQPGYSAQGAPGQAYGVQGGVYGSQGQASGWGNASTQQSYSGQPSYGGQSQGYGGQSQGYGGQSQGYSGPSQGYGGPSHGQSQDIADKGEGKSVFDMSAQLKGTFALILVTAICLHADQNLAAPNLSAIAKDFEMTPLQKDTRLGGMVQFGFFLIGGAVSLVIGPAADQCDRVTLLCGVVLSGAVPSLLMSLLVPASKAGFFYFFLARVCTGIAIGGSFPVLFSLTADLFPASHRPFVSACISAATNIGAAVGGLMSGILGPKLGWRLPFRIVAVPAICCAGLVVLLLKDPRTERLAKEARENRGRQVANPAFNAWMGGKDVDPTPGTIRMEDLDLSKFKRVLSVRSNLFVFAQSLPGCLPLSVITTFLSDYLCVEQGMKVQASTAVTACFGVACLCFAVSGGMIGQKLYSKQKELLCMLMAGASTLAAIPFIILVNSPQKTITSEAGRPTMFAFLLAMCGGCAAITGPNIRAVLMNVNDAEVRGTVFSAFTLTDDLGKGLGPSIVVFMTYIFGRRLAYTFAFCLWWVSATCLLCLKNVLADDAARMGGGDSLLPLQGSRSSSKMK
eukprot:gnl/TRDRNA2_/TRDRNA2_87173_c0_seq1.p1 gnl/TRDRNA2_/TRDRNA2_87173_c0~~gnl/TRDRNA2_/TRDRNA2_87173_c0_seq1.p1  ORF type:complete len:627 (-),score=86.30 gnl/TRDRNA2_/TRDRNA2_87173_c0_seq1:62-1888(-)